MAILSYKLWAYDPVQIVSSSRFGEFKFGNAKFGPYTLQQQSASGGGSRTTSTTYLEYTL